MNNRDKKKKQGIEEDCRHGVSGEKKKKKKKSL